MINVAKSIVRNFLMLTPYGRKIYERRKDKQKREDERILHLYGPEVLRKVHALMTENDITYSVADGTMIGCIRDGGILEHDNDIDFGILPGATTPAKLLRLVLNAGFEFYWAWEYEERIMEFAVMYKGIHIDFDFWQIEGDRMFVHVYTDLPGIKYPTKDEWSTICVYKPIVTKTIEWCAKKDDVTVMVPENYDEFLTMAYGNWRVPDSKWRDNNVRSSDRKVRVVLPKFGKRVSVERVMEIGNR